MFNSRVLFLIIIFLLTAIFAFVLQYASTVSLLYRFTSNPILAYDSSNRTLENLDYFSLTSDDLIPFVQGKKVHVTKTADFQTSLDPIDIKQVMVKHPPNFDRERFHELLIFLSHSCETIFLPFTISKEEPIWLSEQESFYGQNVLHIEIHSLKTAASSDNNKIKISSKDARSPKILFHEMIHCFTDHNTHTNSNTLFFGGQACHPEPLQWCLNAFTTSDFPFAMLYTAEQVINDSSYTCKNGVLYKHQLPFNLEKYIKDTIDYCRISEKDSKGIIVKIDNYLELGLENLTFLELKNYFSLVQEYVEFEYNNNQSTRFKESAELFAPKMEPGMRNRVAETHWKSVLDRRFYKVSLWKAYLESRKYLEEESLTYIDSMSLDTVLLQVALEDTMSIKPVLDSVLIEEFKVDVKDLIKSKGRATD